MEMRTGEVARLVSRHPDTIRSYEARGILPTPRRDPSGWRTYSEQDLALIKAILSGEAKPEVSA